jgi:TonB-linked SusC/RagA family outer membrane protein
MIMSILLGRSLSLVPIFVLATQSPAQQSSHLATQRAQASRGLLSRPARVNVDNMPLAFALAQLVESSDVPIALSPSRLPKDIHVSCACETMTVADALRIMLAKTSMTFSEADGYVVIIPSSMRRVSGGDVAPTEKLVAANDTSWHAIGAPPALSYIAPRLVPLTERAVIRGTVRSRTGAPIAGALVTIPSLQLSTHSSEAGSYQLIVPDDRVVARQDTLRVTRIGFSPERLPFRLAEGTIRVDVVMTEQAVALDQILVSGTAGNQSRRAQSAEVATVDAGMIVRTAPIASVSQLIAERVPGVSVGESNGAVGGTSMIRIRGVSSISLSNEPLVFVDGVKIDYRHMQIGGGTGNVSTLTDLNPSDIESIEVVKGPAAATLYGSDASAGVIQILTKRGTVGSPQFRQSLSVDVARIEPNWTPPSNFARCGAADVAPASVNPLCRGQAVGTLISDNPLLREDILSNGTGTSVRWTGSGGDRGYGYFTAFGYARETGVLPQNELEQATARINFTFLPRSDLTLDANFGLSRDINHQPQLGDGIYSMMLALVGNPLSLGGSANGWLLPGRTGTAIANITNEFTTVRVTPSVKVGYNPRRWFTNRLTLGFDLSRVAYERFLPKNDKGWYPPIENTGFIQQNRYGFDTYTIDYLGNVDRTFGAAQQLRADLSFGVQVIANHSDSALTSGTGLASNTSNVVSSATTVTAGGGRSDQRSVGYLGQLQLGFRDRLFTQIGARIDRNSAFGEAASSFFLPKVGASYVMSDEPYWQSRFPFINTLLLRAAYGTTGRSPTPGASLRTFAPAPYVLSAGVSSPGVILLSPGNSDLRAERGTEFEAGFEAGAWNDRVGLKLTYFNKVTKDLLLQSPLPPSQGFQGAPFVNIGRVVNRGLEGQLSGEIIQLENFAWRARLGISTLHNEVESLGGLAPIRVGIQNSSHFRVGEPLGVFYGRRVTSVDVARQRAIVSDTAEFIGSPMPTSEGNVGSDFTFFRNLQLSAVVYWKQGFRKFNLTDWFRERSSTSSERYQTRDQLPVEERLRLFGPFFSPSGVGVAASSVFEDYVQDASFIRFRELSLTYQAPSRMAALVKASSGSITLGVRNLALWTGYKTGDPESISYVPRDGRFAAAEFNTLPQTRRLYTRVNLAF